MINAFIDTGSEATLLKHSAQTLIAPSRTSEPRRRLQGASGASLAITGDILIGIDLLKRLDFRLGYDSRTNNSYLRLRGKAFTVRYVNKDSLELTAVVMKMKVIKPSSKEAVVWVVNPTLNPVKLRNGTHLVELHEVEEMCDTPEAPGNVASIADTPVAAVPTSALEKISLQHLSDHRDKFAIGEVPDIVHEIPTQEKHPLCQRQWRLPEAAKRHIRPRWQGPAKVVKKLGPVNYVVQDLSPPFSERNCHANQLRPFKLEEELTFPDASPYHDPDYVDHGYLTTRSQVQRCCFQQYVHPNMHLSRGKTGYDHSNTSTSCGLSSETDVARTTNHTWNYRSAQDHRFCIRVPLDLSAQHSQQPPFDVVAASLRSAHARRPVGLAREAL
ncbi:hypothetical protein C7M84_017192 [Penaeus vannamei]|uniref:Peptidase A2 domain-containing protein n=1 Tax=Penaeus vannamei TaxID=6689 RepID=A0A423SKY3_PENVA|nr:hypothetical protein C7M84_017192 [Penaeus vannamei]